MHAQPGPAPSSSAGATATLPVRLSGDAINYNLESLKNLTRIAGRLLASGSALARPVIGVCGVLLLLDAGHAAKLHDEP